ncbi:HAMP domain-containing protein [Rubrobacter tropicus]|uniref:histidine kinase n=1 Tax=Rubrobacter tropicus TaxID=2653851 RepID=A0A6G8QEF6_9ACTN|nr:sensor histidine kinase [Rubrobacter tropicus]QIN84832.1 HAMP domain-containing protein [Rubrobacter tropicus]
MNLRRKLLTTFGVLALLGLTIVGVTFWVILQWQSSSEDLNGHYLRSLEVQRIRAATLEATREVSDALGDEDPDARQEFEDALRGVDKEFELWSDLAETEGEMRQVREVRGAYETIVGNSREFFDLLESGRREEAARLSDAVIEEENFDAFKRTTEAAIASDREKRDVVQAKDRDVRRTAQLVLIIAAFGTVSMLFLLAAYLVSDLFRPLREVEDALDDVGRGDLNRRLDAERSDELGAVSRAFNGMVESLSRRERMGGLASGLAEGAGEENGAAWRDAPSRVTLHRLVSQLRSRVAQLSQDETPYAAKEQRELISQLDGLSQAVARVTEFGFPLDLDLSRTDVRALLYRVFMRFQDEFAERAVSLDLEIAPEVGHAVVDKLKLREAVAELLRNALEALPENGGHLGLRSRLSEDGTELLIEVADDGAGAEQSLIDRAFEPGAYDDGGRPRTGLTLTRAVVEQHGGRFGIESEPGEGTYAQIRLPLRG